jgi:acyl-homoserine-lactone acylase
VDSRDAPHLELGATIRRTTYGVPHIEAPDFTSLGFGFGYAFAKDNLCTMADRYVTVSGERSRFFGPDGSWTFSGNETENNNLLSDFFYQRINKSRIVEELLDSAPPAGPLPEFEEVVRGYVAGYNRYLRQTGVHGLPDPRCRGKEWVRPIREIDVWRHFYQLGSLASSGVAIEGIGGAEPVAGANATAARAEQRAAIGELEAGERELKGFPLASGSNGYAFGADATADGPGLLLGNPHFPWDGAERLYQIHLTIPGKLDVAGATLYGFPLVLIGHTDDLAWTHTTATAWRFTPFELTLAPGDPHSYLVDGQVKRMKPITVAVKARTANGGLETRARTLYDTDYGPVFTELAGLPFPWTTTKAYALGDVNARNFRYLNHFFRTNLARSVEEYDRIQRRLQGIPWVNSIAVDRGGSAYYSMDGAIPNVPDSKARSCAASIGAALFETTGIPALDGSRSACRWGNDPDAATPGIFGPSKIPRLSRRDYVFNGNDSHWISNPERPLEGFERIIGDERTQRTLRTRLGLVMVRDRLRGTDGLDGTRFSLRALEQVALGNRQYAGELWRDELVGLCESGDTQTGSTGPVDVSEACPVLARWDLHDDLDSNGAILFRRFVENLLANFPSVPTGTPSGQMPGDDSLYDVPFDPSDPVDTPRGLNTDNPLVRRALADAVADLRGAGIRLDASLRPYQYTVRGGQRIPIHGGPGRSRGSGQDGLFNAINVEWDPAKGYPNVPHGTSFITAVSFRRRGCPVAAGTFVTYGQSENPASRHADDYTRAFSRKDWNEVPYCPDEIRRDPNLEVERVATTIAIGPDGGADGDRRSDRDGRDHVDPDRRTAPGSGSAGDEAGGEASAADHKARDGRSLPFTGLGAGAVVLVGVLLIAGGALVRRGPSSRFRAGDRDVGQSTGAARLP